MRGWAVFLMIIYHIFYDLNYLGLISIQIKKNIYWWTMPKVIVFLFLLSMGISLRLVHSPQIRWTAFTRRWVRLAFFAGLISLTTYLLFPTRWVYFGTLHCIAISSLVSLPLLKYPRLAGFLGTALIIPLGFGLRYPWVRMSHSSMDYIPALPWVAVGFLGIWAHHLKLHQLPTPRHSLSQKFEFLGRWSLWIYLIHQPIIFPLIYLLDYLKS